MTSWKPYTVLLAGLALLVIVWNYLRSAPVGIYTETKDDKAVAGMAKAPISGAPVKALPPAAKRKLGLPQTVQDDPSKHVVETAQFPITSQPFTAVAVYDDKSGDVSVSVRNDPLPWLAAERRYYVRMGYGVKTKIGNVGQLAVGGNFVQMKALHVGGSIELFTDGDGYAGLHVEYQF